MDQIPFVPAQRSTGTTIAARLDLWSVVCPGFRMHVPARLRFDPQDPYAVRLDHYVDYDETVTWVFARELLARGLTGWAGTGDVSVYPGAGGTQSVFISLHGAADNALLQAERDDIRRFVQHTQCLVPFGSERDHFDLDALLPQLLESPPTDRRA